MAQLARWYVVLGLACALPAAVLLGSSIGEALRAPGLGDAGLYRYEGPIVVLLAASVFLFSAASGLRHHAAWAHWLALAEALFLVVLGLIVLLAGSPLLAGLDAPQVYVVLGIPAGLGAVLVGARLTVALRRTAAEAAPFSARDLRALAWLAGVAVVAAVAHVLLAGLAAQG